MKPRAWLPRILLVALCVLPSASSAETLAIEGATVVDVVDGSLLPDQTVLIEGNRIAAVASRVDVPADARTLDAAGQYVIPGLWDTHVHSATNIDWHAPLFLAYGVTGVRNMHTTVGDALGLTNDIKRRVVDGDLLGPRFVANGPIIDGDPSAWPGAVVVHTDAQARAAVDSLADGGADFIKVYDNLSREAYFAIADESRRRGIPFAGHVPFRIRPEEAAAAGQRTDEHMIGLEHGCSARADSVRQERTKLGSLPFPDGFIGSFRCDRALYDTRDSSLCDGTIEAYVKYGMVVVPNLVIHYNNDHPDEVLSDPSMRYVPPAMRARWADRSIGDQVSALMEPTSAARADNVRRLDAAGVMLLAGTDLGNPMLVPGISLHQELQLLVQAGLTPLRALQTATINPARFLETTDSLGTVEAGKLADLVLLEANPLEDIRNTRRIRAVVTDGRLLDRATLDTILEGVARSFEEH